MVPLPAAVLAHLEAYHGVASYAQLTDLGVTAHTIRRLRRDGLLREILRGVYQLRGQPLTYVARCVAVCAAHPGHVIAGPAAGRLWEFRGLGRELRVNTISPPASRPTTARWVEVYRTAAINFERDVVHRSDGVVLTTRARTAMDLARWLDDGALLSVIEQAAHDGRLTVDELVAVGADWISPHRRWLTRYLRLVDGRLEGGAAESHPEVVVGDALVQAGLCGLVRQHRVVLPGFGPARFDLAVPSLQWAIEVDMFPTHAETAGRLSDRQRDDAAAAMGWVTTRLGPDRLGAALGATVADLLDTYQALSAGDASSHRGTSGMR